MRRAADQIGGAFSVVTAVTGYDEVAACAATLARQFGRDQGTLPEAEAVLQAWALLTTDRAQLLRGSDP